MSNVPKETLSIKASIRRFVFCVACGFGISTALIDRFWPVPDKALNIVSIVCFVIMFGCALSWIGDDK